MNTDTLTYNEPYIFPGSLKSGKIRRIPVKKVYDEDHFRLYPNPAREWTTFDYQLPDDISKGVIKIIDVYGKIIETIAISGYQGQRIWDTRNIKSGVYFYNLNIEGFSKIGKIVISK